MATVMLRLSLLTLLATVGYALECSKDEFQCETWKCLPNQIKCNGLDDCPNGSDEEPSACNARNTTLRRREKQHVHLTCNSSTVDIEFLLCNKSMCNKLRLEAFPETVDLVCKYGSSCNTFGYNCKANYIRTISNFPFGTWSCPGNFIFEVQLFPFELIISLQQHADKEIILPALYDFDRLWVRTKDWSDNKNLQILMPCQRREIPCHNGQCIPVDFKCNGTAECSDGSDEWTTVCSAGNTTLFVWDTITATFHHEVAHDGVDFQLCNATDCTALRLLPESIHDPSGTYQVRTTWQSRPKSQSPTRTRPLRSTRLRAKSQDPPTSQPVVQVTESGDEDDPVEEGGSSDINDPVQQRESSGLPIRSGSRAKKRKFSGNRYTIRQWNNNDETKSIPTSNTSTRPIKMSIGVTNVAPKMSIGMTQEDGLSIRPRSKSLTCSGSPIQTRSTRRAKSQDPPLQNRSSVPVPVPELRPSGVGASSWKLQSSSDSVVDESRQNWSGFRIIDIDKVFGELKEFLVCSRCFMRQVTIYEKSHVGLSSIYYVECLSKKCGVVKQFRGCDLVVDGRDNRSIAEVNRRSVYAFKSLGLGHAAYAEFCGLMDFPAPVNSKTFSKAVDTISLETSEVADASMKRAAKEETKLTGSSDISVSGDGSWHTKGFSSKLGICTLIGLYTGKVIDFFVLSLVCKICDLFKGPRDSDAFLSNQANHAEKCTRNHVGSSKSMEVQGMKKMFQRSVMKRNVRYKRYIGDGDSATYKQVSADKPYGEDFTISKFECTSHVKKRMGTRLRNEKKALKGKKLSDNGSIGGRGRLTDKAIDQIALYYGIAVKSSKDVESMKIAIWAIYYHMSASDSNPSHQFCPKGLQSWCSYQKAAAAGELTQYKHKKNLPLPVMEACKNVFDDLTKTELLERCVGGYTQNPNESLNAEVWNHCPKAKNFGKKSVEFASAEATICWNEGHRGKLEVMKKLGIKPGNYCVTWAIKTDQKRTVQSNLREEASSKEARQAKKREMLHQLRNENDDSYVPGGH